MMPVDECIDYIANSVLPETIRVDATTPTFARDMAVLIVKFTKRHNILEQFIDVLPRGVHSRCIMSHNDKFPGTFGRANLVILRLFNMPWVRYDSQIVSASICRHQYKPGCHREVCMNPWHYKANVKPQEKMEPVLINRQYDYGFVPDLVDYLTSEIPDDDTYGNSLVLNDLQSNGYRSKTITVEGDEMKKYFEKDSHASSSPGLSFRPVDDNPYQSAIPSPDSTASPPMFFRADDVEMMDTSSAYIMDALSRQPKAEPYPLFTSSGVGNLGNMSSYDCIEYEEPVHWVNMTYHEYNEVVAGPKGLSSLSVLIDGFCSPDNTEKKRADRFSLGFYSNPNRSNTAENIRNVVQEGCRIYIFGGEVFVESLIDMPIYVHSIMGNVLHDFTPATVIKLRGKCTFKVFSNNKFSEILRTAAERSFCDVYSLAKMCTFRVAFGRPSKTKVKLHDMSSSPTWVSCCLNGPLFWIDKVLQAMGMPNMACSSRT